MFIVVCVTTAVAATGVLLMWAMWPYANTVMKYCDSAECKLASEELLLLMNINVNPCDNFHQHVCGRVDDRAFGNADIVERAREDMLISLQRRLLGRKKTESQYPVLDQLAAAFTSCYAFGTYPHQLVHAGIRDVVANNTSILASKDTASALRHVVRLSLLSGITTLYSISVVTHSGELCLYVSRGKSMREKMGLAADTAWFPEFLGQLVEYTFAGLSNFSVENATTEVSPLLKFDRILLPQRRASEEAEMSGITKTVFMDYIGGDDWFTFINNLLPSNLKFKNTSNVLATEIDVVKLVVDEFRKNHTLGLSYILTQISIEIGRFYRIPLGRLTNTCLQLAEEILPPVWATVFNNLTTPLMSDPTRADAIFLNVRNVFAKHLLKMGLSEDDDNLIASYIKNVRLHFHNTMMTTSPNASVWFPSEMSESSAALPKLHAKLKTREALRRLVDPPSAEEAILGRHQLSNDVTYSRILNIIVLPAALRRPPVLYSSKVPIEFDMGVVGVLLATQVFRASEPPERSFEDWYHHYAGFFSHCLAHSKLLSEVADFNNLPRSRALHIFMWTYSLLIAYRAVREHYEEQSEATNFRDVLQSAQQILFRRFCLLTCGGSLRNNTDEPRLDCIVPVANTPEFFDAFGCASYEAGAGTSCVNLA
ncbi:hypothetical protein V5799_020638 [Amblyomma americanum]|uniref:Uncharacterized protein n=1 Tax=Amblyomma americanum TaxID=6943 RepID=A0AAQ4ETJ5_AMBAM